MSHLNNILFQLDTLRMRTARHLTQSRKLIIDMTPEAITTPRFFKRALLPFVGDLARSIFGIASEKSVRTLAEYINALTKQPTHSSYTARMNDSTANLCCINCVRPRWQT